MEHDLTAHFWICPTLTASECCVFELLVKGYTVTQISESRSRSAKTVSIQKHQIYKNLGYVMMVMFR
ncbi:TPA: LuxR C-terminal-related transcriptional regulator [Escherichia coli]|uniref:LuxR C-terminal-related transcriptional regulator n=1 Tax=Escherichia coli TaxID=562 RepID=UPI00208E9DF7|nr:LuxR C-terminal-related transcriptional regulator [Escherichia coli]